jgi:protein TonB
VPPVYPTIAQTARVEGDVIVEALIDETGVVRNVRVLRSIPLLDRAAVDAVSRWRYSPTTLNNQTVPVIMTVTVSFKLR